MQNLKAFIISLVRARLLVFLVLIIGLVVTAAAYLFMGRTPQPSIPETTFEPSTELAKPQAIDDLPEPTPDAEPAQVVETAPKPAYVARPSFDCSKARLKSERLICESDYLANLDLTLNRTYNEVVADSSAEIAQALRSSQLAWMRERNRCEDEFCVQSKYLDRINYLRSRTKAEPEPEAREMVFVEPKAPRPKNSPSSWIQARDYPIRALRREVEGTVRFLLEIDREGRVYQCRVTSTSGSPELDRAACEALKRRAEFYPAEDSVGQPVAGTYSSQISFNLD